MIAACILLQTQAGQAAIVAAARRDLLRVSETGEAGRPLRRHLRQARDIDELAKLVASGPGARRHDADDELPGRSPEGNQTRWTTTARRVRHVVIPGVSCPRA